MKARFTTIQNFFGSAMEKLLKATWYYKSKKTRVKVRIDALNVEYNESKAAMYYDLLKVFVLGDLKLEQAISRIDVRKRIHAAIQGMTLPKDISEPLEVTTIYETLMSRIYGQYAIFGKSHEYSATEIAFDARAKLIALFNDYCLKHAGSPHESVRHQANLAGLVKDALTNMEPRSNGTRTLMLHNETTNQLEDWSRHYQTRYESSDLIWIGVTLLELNCSVVFRNILLQIFSKHAAQSKKTPKQAPDPLSGKSRQKQTRLNAVIASTAPTAPSSPTSAVTIPIIAIDKHCTVHTLLASLIAKSFTTTTEKFDQVNQLLGKTSLSGVPDPGLHKCLFCGDNHFGIDYRSGTPGRLVLTCPNCTYDKHGAAKECVIVKAGKSAANIKAANLHLTQRAKKFVNTYGFPVPALQGKGGQGKGGQGKGGQGKGSQGKGGSRGGQGKGGSRGGQGKGRAHGRGGRKIGQVIKLSPDLCATFGQGASVKLAGQWEIAKTNAVTLGQQGVNHKNFGRTIVECGQGSGIRIPTLRIVMRIRTVRIVLIGS